MVAVKYVGTSGVRMPSTAMALTHGENRACKQTCWLTYKSVGRFAFSLPATQNSQRQSIPCQWSHTLRSGGNFSFYSAS
jgi:hypothetical protein